MKCFDLSSFYDQLNLTKIQKQFPNLQNKIQDLETIQSYEYKNKKIAALALIHGSALVHWPKNKAGVFSNEKFEYLGDSFLNFFIAFYSLSLLPELSEGECSKLRARIVGASHLASKSRAFNLGSCLVLGKSKQEAPYETQEGILADAFEAITAALFLDAGFEKATKWLSSVFKEDIRRFSKHLCEIDVKGAVQNWTQREKGIVPLYEVKDCTTDVRSPEFEVSLLIENKVVAIARASSKKEASIKAARSALELIKSGKIQ